MTQIIFYKDIATKVLILPNYNLSMFIINDKKSCGRINYAYINAECFITFEFIMHVGIQNVKIMNTRIHAWVFVVSIFSFLFLL